LLPGQVLDDALNAELRRSISSPRWKPEMVPLRYDDVSSCRMPPLEKTTPVAVPQDFRPFVIAEHGSRYGEPVTSISKGFRAGDEIDLRNSAFSASPRWKPEMVPLRCDDVSSHRMPPLEKTTPVAVPQDSRPFVIAEHGSRYGEPVTSISKGFRAVVKDADHHPDYLSGAAANPDTMSGCG
jgi:hypothetical protein